MRTCDQCAKTLPERRTGRPASFCSPKCRKEAFKGRVKENTAILDNIDATGAERKIYAVWNDDRLRAKWFAVMALHKELLKRLTWKFACSWELPAEMRDSTAVITNAQGKPVYWFKNTFQAIVAMAIAELVYEHRDITEAMLTNRVESRLADNLRRSDEYERAETTIVPQVHQDRPVTIRSANGSVRVEKQPVNQPVTKRLPRKKKLPSRRYSLDKDVAGDRAAAVAERQQKIKAMPRLMRTVYQFWKSSQMSPGDIAGLLSTPARVVTAAEVEESFREGPFKELLKVLTGTMPRPDLYLRVLLRIALEWVGEELPAELEDNGPEVFDDDPEITEGPLRELLFG